MALSIWSEITNWVEETYEDGKDWIHSVWAEINDDVSSTSDLSHHTSYETAPQPAQMQLSILSSSPSSIVTSAPIQATPKFLPSSLTSSQPTASQVKSDYSANLHGNFGMILLFFGAGILATIVLYLVTPVIIRFCQFAYNFTRIWLSNDSSGSFSRDSESGLSSEAFSLTRNIDGGDQRNGLDKPAKLRILWYMFIHGESFDEARLRFVRYQFIKNGIGADGQPLDPKYQRRS